MILGQFPKVGEKYCFNENGCLLLQGIIYTFSLSKKFYKSVCNLSCAVNTPMITLLSIILWLLMFIQTLLTYFAIVYIQAMCKSGLC